MLVKKRIAFVVLVLLVVVSSLLLSVNFAAGPTITVNNCNENSILSFASEYNESAMNCRICNNGRNHYYVNGDKGIYKIGEDKNSSLFFDEKGICYVACNSDYVYAIKGGEIIQLTHRGNIVKRVEIGNISGIYAAEDAVLYTDDKYNILDAENLAEMSIKDFLKYPKVSKIADYKIVSGDKYTIVSKAPVFEENFSDLSSFIGTVFVDDNKIINLTSDTIIGHTDDYFLKYAGFNTNLVVKDIAEGVEFYDFHRTDIRHITAENDLLISFSSVYSDKSFLKFFYISPNKYKGGSDCAEEKTLFFHSYDEASIINCNNSEAVTYKTMSGEKIIYINAKKMITYHKGEYITYSVDTWEKINSCPADEIKKGGKYTFEACGGYIFVFDDKTREMIDTIEIP